MKFSLKKPSAPPWNPLGRLPQGVFSSELSWSFNNLETLETLETSRSSMRPLSFNKIMENHPVFLGCSWIAADRTASFIFCLFWNTLGVGSSLRLGFYVFLMWRYCCSISCFVGTTLLEQKTVQHGQEQGGPQLQVSKEFLRIQSMKYRSIDLSSKETKHLHMGKNTWILPSFHPSYHLLIFYQVMHLSDPRQLLFGSYGETPSQASEYSHSVRSTIWTSK